MKSVNLLLIVLFAMNLWGEQGGIERKIYTASKVNPRPPSMDGKLGDIIWTHVVFGDGFLQVDPVEGDPPSEKTFFKICYDERNIYVLIRSYDSEPEKITARLSRRDDIEDSDMVGILLDSYFDRRTAFEFSVNAAGIKYDAVYADDSRYHPDKSWDPVWEVVTTIDDSGWVAEMRIPFSQLRYASKREHLWGMEIYRYIHRKQESTEWQLISKEAPGFVSYFGHLQGIRNISTSKRVEILPYAVSNLHTYEKEKGNPFATGRNALVSGGLDGKMGLSRNLTVDFTINPDFGQVEADPSEVNLTAFETFFEERRPFFIEGKNIFQFPLGIGDGDFARETLFYSRRIGRSPQHEPDVNDDEYLKIPKQTSILGAAKLSGKTANGWSIGILDALTAEEQAEIDFQGIRRKEIVEPFTNYFVGRLQKDFNKGNTYFGGIATATNRNINRSYLNYINRSAYTGGIDFTHQWSDKTYFADLKLAYSHVRGHKEAILEVQTSSARYYQRPDADYVSLDSNRSSLDGHGGSVSLGRQGNGRWRYVLGTVWRSPGLELNDLGFLQRADRAMQFIWIGYQVVNPIWIFRNLGVNINQWNGWNFGGEEIFDGGNVNGGGQFKNYWGFWAGINREGDGLSTTALRGGPAARYEGGWNNWYEIYSDSRKKWQIHFAGFNHWNDDQISRYHSVEASLNLKPSNRLYISISPNYDVNKDNLQYIDTVDKDGTDRYIMGRINQKTFALVLRFNLSITPDLTIQFYGQPFVSAGQYSLFKRVTEPRAKKYEDRFQIFGEDEIYYDPEKNEYQIDENGDGKIDYSFESPDFNFKQFRSNFVIRWEFRPGSQIYLVWSQDRTVSDDFGDFSLRRDYKNIYNQTADNVFLIKINRWFSL